MPSGYRAPSFSSVHSFDPSTSPAENSKRTACYPLCRVPSPPLLLYRIVKYEYSYCKVLYLPYYRIEPTTVPIQYCGFHYLLPTSTTYNLLPNTSCLLPTTYYLLPAIPNNTYYLLPATCYLLPTIPTTYYLLPTAYYLPATYCLLPTTCYLLPATYYLLPTTYYRLRYLLYLPTTYCTYYLLPATYYILYYCTYYLLPTTYRTTYSTTFYE